MMSRLYWKDKFTWLEDDELKEGDFLVISTPFSDTGNAPSNASTLNVDSNTDIAGYLKVNTDKFTVASASGDTIVAGTMTIDGHTELNNTLNVD